MRRVTSMNSRAKGIRGELEVRDLLRAEGYLAERGQQHSGGSDAPDVKHDIPNVHIEVKYDERAPGSMWRWMSQAVRDAAGLLMPVVFFRRNHCDWLVTMRSDDFFKLMAASRERAFIENPIIPENW